MNFFRRKIKRDAAAPNSQSFHRQLEEKYDAKMQIEQPVSIKPRLRSYFALRQSLYLSDTKSFDSPRSDIATPAPARMSLCITEPAQLGGITSAGVDLTNGREGRTLVKDSEGSDDKVARRRSILGFSFRDRRGLRKASNSGNDTTADADTAVPEMVLDASGHVSKLMSLGTKRRDSQSSDDSNGGDSDDTLASKNAENMMVASPDTTFSGHQPVTVTGFGFADAGLSIIPKSTRVAASAVCAAPAKNTPTIAPPQPQSLQSQDTCSGSIPSGDQQIPEYVYSPMATEKDQKQNASVVSQYLAGDSVNEGNDEKEDLSIITPLSPPRRKLSLNKKFATVRSATINSSNNSNNTNSNSNYNVHRINYSSASSSVRSTLLNLGFGHRHHRNSNSNYSNSNQGYHHLHSKASNTSALTANTTVTTTTTTTNTAAAAAKDDMEITSPTARRRSSLLLHHGQHRASLDESWLKRNSTGIRRGLAVKRSGSGLKKFVAQPTAIQQARMDEWAADDDEFSPYEYDVSGAYFDFPLLPTIDGSSRGAATTRDASKLAKPGPRLSDASTMVDSKQCSAEQCKRIFVSSVRKLQWHSARYGIAGIMHIRNTMAKANEAYTIVSGGKRLNSYQASIAALANLCANGSDPLVVEGQRSGPFAIPPKQLSAGGSIGGRSGSSKRGSSAGVDKGRASKAGAGSGGSSGASGARDMLHDKPRLGTHDFGKTNPFSSAFSLAPATEAAEIDSGSPASPREVQGNEAQAQLWLPVPQPALAIDDSELLGFGAGDLVSLSPVDGVGPDDGAEDADSPGICSRTHQPYRRRRVNKRAGSGSVGLP